MLRLFKNKLFILILATVAIFIIMGVSSQPGSKLHYFGNVLSVPLSPLQKFTSFIGGKVEGSFTFFSDIRELKKENEELKTKVNDLLKENRDLLRFKKENEILRETLNLKDQFKDYKSVGGNIIAKDAGNWFNIFTIDIGVNDGVTTNSPVITSRGLAGSITETSPFSSKVLSIIDVDSTVSAIVSKSMDIVRVRGDLNLKDQGLCRMDYIPVDLDLEVGDTIETSGVGGIYPKGILIGKVKEIRKASNELNRYAIIEPVVDFKRLQEVFVLINKNKNTEIGSVQK